MTTLGTTHIKAPVLGVVEAFHPHWLAEVLKYAVAIGGAAGLFAAAGSAMLGVSRVGYSLATNRQIPSAIGRLHGKWGTPFVVIGAAAVAAARSCCPTNLDFLVGIYAFGALLAFTIAHVSVIALRFREPDRDAALPDAAVDRGAGRQRARPGGGRSAWRRRSGGWRCSCSTPAPGTWDLAWLLGGIVALRHLPQDPAEAAAAAGDDPRARAAPRGARAGVRLDPGPDPRHPARRRHRPDGRPAGRRDARRPRVGGRR